MTSKKKILISLLCGIVLTVIMFFYLSYGSIPHPCFPETCGVPLMRQLTVWETIEEFLSITTPFVLFWSFVSWVVITVIQKIRK